MLFAAVLIAWVLLNAFLLSRNGDTFNRYPYILLNLFLSMLASVQAPLILMSQNRQSAKDRLHAEHDYEVNLKFELEIMVLHEKLDELREGKWTELIKMQQEQIELLTKFVRENKQPSVRLKTRCEESHILASNTLSEKNQELSRKAAKHAKKKSVWIQ